MNNLEELCRPIITKICNLKECSNLNVDLNINVDQLKSDIKALLIQIKETVSTNNQLYKDYLVIEIPLIFFIDYMIKESNFSFSKSWVELARDYGELSGDEKFFELLTVALNNSSSKDVIGLFYLMMGVGFKGIYKKEPEVIEQKMKLCISKIGDMKDISKDYVTYIEPTPFYKRKKVPFYKLNIFYVFIAFFIAIISLGFNLTVFYDEISEFRKAVNNAVINASPYETK